jgi:trehalose/maltose transport system substrate-binding protein
MNGTHKAQISFSGLPQFFLAALLMSISCCVGCSHAPAKTTPVGDIRSQALTMMPTGLRSTDLSFLLRELELYREKTGVRINTLAAYDGVDTRLRLLRDIFAKKSPEPDICEIDNIWPGLLANDLIDLKPYLGDELTAIDKGMLDDFTIAGRLVALPEITDTAVLYYRTDLVEKYGYKGPPRTWDEMGHMARVIQDGERRAGATDFWGYIWQGAEGESLNCNALEWQRGEGAELIDKSGSLCAVTPAAESALRRARSWVGTISPPSVVEYDEEDSYNVWLAGSAAFARGWLSLYEPSKASPHLTHKFATAPLPAGKNGYAWMFGGMGIAVSRYSVNPKAAVQVIRYLISSDVQRRRLIAAATIPTRTNLLSDASSLRNTAFNGWLSQHWREGMCARPSAQSGRKYDSISRAYSKAVHDVVSGKRDPHQALMQLHTELASIMGSPRSSR